MRRVKDAQYLNGVVHDVVDDTVRIAGYDALARAGRAAGPTQQRELGQAIGGAKDRPDHPIGSGGSALGIIGVGGADIVLRRRHEDNPHPLVRPSFMPSTKSDGSIPSAWNRATTSSMGIPSPARDSVSPS